jgi:isoamylase
MPSAAPAHPQEDAHRINWAESEGSTLPLGATWCEQTRAWNFALYSKHAEQVTLLLYGADDFAEPRLRHTMDYLHNKSGRIWHCRIPERAARDARYYAYRVSGPQSDGGFEQHAFSAQKVLLDPYARAVFFPPDFDRAAACRPGPNDGKAPLGVLTSGRETFDWRDDRQPRHESDLVIYELHVRGFTRSASSGVAPQRRGTYSGLIEKIPYLKDLGITAVELMPVHQFDPQEGNYWGYMPLSFFAPHHGYASGPQENRPHDEFREMVKALHAADIEVILDVVYNHTAEGDERGPVYSYKGIDNSTYYIVNRAGTTDPGGSMYRNFSGTGNTLHCANRYVRKLIVDSLRYWAREMHVDGFRFDLASVFTRAADGSLSTADPPIFGDILSEPDLAAVRLIAEPWDAAGTYQLGRGFPGARWLQWNGRFRDDVRRFVRGDLGMVPMLMQRLYGSDDLFPDDRQNAYHAYQSVNYIASHDGFTLYDLVSFNRKHNEANGHENRDGADENFSWNCGWEGDPGAPADVLKLRVRQAKNCCALLFLANGTPMLRSGDEFLQTQRGNNNPYNQDNETSWLDWNLLERNAEVFRFFRAMIRFRRAHPTLGRSRFWREDVRWFGTGSAVDMGPKSRTLALYLDGASQRDVDLYMLINGSDRATTFEIQIARPGGWRRVLDTGLESPDDFPEPAAMAPPLAGTSYRLVARSIALLCAAGRESP